MDNKMDKQKAIKVLNKAPEGWEFYSESRNKFYMIKDNTWHGFLSEYWQTCYMPIGATRLSLISASKVKAIAEVD